jgi:predicted metalloprotease
MPARLLLPALLLALAACLSGCGSNDVSREVERVRTQAEQVRRDVERRITRAQREFEQRRERYGRRIEQVLGDLEKQFQQPERTSPTVRSRGNDQPTTIDAFLTDLLRNIDRFWTRTLTASDLPEPTVRYDWVAPGASVLTGCGERAGDRAAFYCPADDTIYIAQRFAAELYAGVARGLPGERAGVGRAAGDFAVAYVLAHEYAHNLQQELGVFDNRVTRSAQPFELQADCLAGVWAYSVYAAGDLDPGDLEEATNAALAVGDFDVGNAQHHGTPTERRDALLAGYREGRPADCNRYLV